MSQRHFEALARLAAWIGVAALIVLSLVPGQYRPHTPFPGQVDHFMAYALAGAAAALGYPRPRSRIWWQIALTAFACAAEILQHWIPGRSPSPLDAIASSAGLAAGLIVASLFRAALTPGLMPADAATPGRDRL